MAEILPIKAWRYNKQLSDNIEELTSPLFDVVSDKQRLKLYQHPFNSIHLSVPSGPAPAQNAAMLMDVWKKSGILQQDQIPGIYVYYQYYTMPGSQQQYCRKGFICHIKTHEFEDKVILRHENTIPKAVNDRVELLKTTQLHASATHGLYTDDDKILEQYMDESIQYPIYETEDYQGVRDVFSVIHDMKVIRIFMETLKNKKVILADGHHRYEGSLELQRQRKLEKPDFTGDESWNYHLMYLTNTQNDGFRILPTHRLIKDIENFDEDEFLKKLETYFTLKPLENAPDIPEIIHGKEWAFGLILPERAFKLRLKPEVLALMDWKFPKEVRELDLTVLHYYIIEKVLGIPGSQQRKSDKITFERNFTDCLTQVIKGQSQMAIVTNEITIDEVVKVCDSGYTLPQKSTYFYPKVICGFLFSSINDSEFTFPTDPCLQISATETTS
ncbi:DUF1015 domain-containing protein [Peijinzhouia sedimentorum]